jgi:hypothetical protein
MATQFKFLLVDEDGDLFGTDSQEVADAAVDVGFVCFKSDEVPELDSDSVMPDEEGED